MSSNGKTQDLRLTPHQLGAMLVFDAQLASLQVGANQLGGFLKLEREATVLVGAIQHIQREKDKLMAEWAKAVQIFPVAAMPALPPGPDKG